MTVNLALMIILIVQLAQQSLWMALTLGTVGMGISLFGISFYSFLTIKEIQLNRRQSNFVDSVTHELKTPIAALRLYLDTLILRDPGPEDRQDFYATMDRELGRLDRLINQLLEVGRLDAIGDQTEAELVSLPQLLQHCAETASLNHKVDMNEVFQMEITPISVMSRRLLLEMIFGNLLDNAVKYGGTPPRVFVSAFPRGADRVVIRIRDNGPGVPEDHRRRIFQMFFRGNDELQRTKTGTGLGLYIVKTLVGILKGRISVLDVSTQEATGSIFEVILPGRQVSAPTPELSTADSLRARVAQLALAGRHALEVVSWKSADAVDSNRKGASSDEISAAKEDNQSQKSIGATAIGDRDSHPGLAEGATRSQTVKESEGSV
ncbi:MAG: HAMP domain-containing histidine kinase [Planctomycetaceae bacterium]|nr:HAMP domain-containing histidine kinase [Planctomycetaceae bacterium]